MLNLVDSIISAIDPVRGLRRRMARLALSDPLTGASGERRLDNLAPNRGNKEWLAKTEDPNDAVQDPQALRDKLRSLRLNNSFFKRQVDAMVTVAVGDGLKVQSRVMPDKEGIERPPARLRITEAQAQTFRHQSEANFRTWSKKVDTGRSYSLGTYQQLLLRTWLLGGELFTRYINLPDDPFLPLALRPYEPDQIVTPTDVARDPKIRNGIEYDEFMRPVRYFVLKWHPGSKNQSKGLSTKADRDFDIVPAAEMNHFFVAERPGQLRGYSPLASVLDDYHNLDTLAQAKLFQEKIAACFAVFIKTQSPADQIAQLQEGAERDLGNNRFREVLISQGSVNYLAEDEEVEFADPNRPGTTMGAFARFYLQRTGAAGNTPYEEIALDFTESNYSNMRALLVEFREAGKINRAPLVGQTLDDVFARATVQGMAAKRIISPASFKDRRDDWLATEWRRDKHEWIDPVKSAAGNKVALETGEKLYADVIDGDTADHFDAMGAERRQMEANGLEYQPTKTTLVINAGSADEEATPPS